MLAVCCTEHHDSISENNAERHKLTDGINPLPINVLTPTATETPSPRLRNETVSGNRIGSCGPEKVILVTFSPRDTPDQFEKLRCIVLIDRIYSELDMSQRGLSRVSLFCLVRALVHLPL